MTKITISPVRKSSSFERDIPRKVSRSVTRCIAPKNIQSNRCRPARRGVDNHVKARILSPNRWILLANKKATFLKDISRKAVVNLSKERPLLRENLCHNRCLSICYTIITLLSFLSARSTNRLEILSSLPAPSI